MSDKIAKFPKRKVCNEYADLYSRVLSAITEAAEGESLVVVLGILRLVERGLINDCVNQDDD